MNLLPLIHHSRKKNFISPLSGIMLPTSQFQAETEEKRANNAYPASPTNTIPSFLLRPAKTEHRLKQSYLDESGTERKKFKSTKLYHTLDPNTLNENKAHMTNRVNRVKEQESTSNFVFPKVEITPLHLISKHEDIKTLTLTVKLQQYLKLLFNRKISHTCSQLNAILQKYYPLLKEDSLFECPIQKQKWPAQFWQVKNTYELLNLLKQYTSKSNFWNKYIFVLLRLYCLPLKQTRKRILDNLILMLGKQFSERDPQEKTELVLLKADGTVVKDIIDIPFDAKHFYVCRKGEDPKNAFQKFGTMELEFEIATKKKGFNGRLRNYFRKEIVPHKFDQESINYHSDFPQVKKQREESLEKAMKLLQLKKQRSRNNITTLTMKGQQHQQLMTERPKSKESLWREENVEDSQVDPEMAREGLYFNINIGSKKMEKAIQQKFKHYRELSVSKVENLPDQHILMSVLEKHHPVLSKLNANHFNSDKLLKVLEVLTDSKIPEEHSSLTIRWKHFVQLEILASKNVQEMVKLPDCYQILRNFTEGYLNMKDQDYFRDELASRLYRTVEGDKEGLELMEDVIWSWLDSNGFIKHEAIQREVLWGYPTRSKTFYLLITSMALGTFDTTPLDLAHELLF